MSTKEVPTTAPAVALPTIEEVAAQLAEGGVQLPEDAPAPAPLTPDTVAVSDDGTALPISAAEIASAVAPPDAVKVEEPKRDPLAAKFAALARREKENRLRAEDVASRAKALEDKEKELSAREARRSAASKRPLDLLKDHGFSYSDATQEVLGGYTPAEPDPVDTKLGERLSPIEKEMADAKKEIDELRQFRKDVESERVTRYLQEVQQGIRATAKAGDYELIQAVGDEAYILIQDVIAEYFKKNQKLLSYDEACSTVEAHYTSYAKKLADTKKMRALFPGVTPAAAAPEAKSPVKNGAKEKSTTLTQSHSTSVAKPLSGVDHLDKHAAIAELAKTLTFDR